MMRLTVVLPDRVLLSADVARVRADAPNGQFCLRPRHVDLATALVAGVLELTDEDGTERYVGHGEGLLVKAGDEVLVTVRQGAVGDALGTLRAQVEASYARTDEREQLARAATARLEAGLVRRFVGLERHER